MRIGMKRPMTDHRTGACVEVEHRREAEIDAAGAELGGDQAPPALGSDECAVAIAIEMLAELAHRRNRREAVLKALHATTLVIDGDQQRRVAQAADGVRQRE